MATQPVDVRSARRGLAEAAVVMVAYFAISLWSRYDPILFLAVVGLGLLLPLGWAWIARDWRRQGFARAKLGPSLGLGAVIGLLTIVYLLLTHRDPAAFPPPMLGVQLAAGVPIWLLILSPFQEFLFRGWLQPRLTEALGYRPGLALTAVLFAVWHYLPPFQGTTTSSLDLSSVGAVLTMLWMGLAFCWAFRRTENIAAPWLAHALMGVGTILVGRMTLVTVMP